MRRLVLLPCVLAAVAALAACGGGGGGDADDGGESAAEPTTWVDQVCTALVSWRDDVEAAAGDLGSAVTESASAEDLRSQLSGFLSDVVTRTDGLLEEVDGAGTPDVDQGEAIRADLQSVLADVREVIAGAQQDAESLPTDDLASFATAAQELGTSIQTGIQDVGTTFADLNDRYDVPELEEAFQANATCGELG
jgi:hypothetical protein